MLINIREIPKGYICISELPTSSKLAIVKANPLKMTFLLSLDLFPYIISISL